ncbi:uncharacterized protein LOC124934852 [Impatiens glandulifera]|uniref:uncharacterized protein LOC124934852 n=1 Tax=Impatiens glandulifera TaxID=253017 RepID=UPI001FB06091|nr:uncharacterized protein LOC124934852 [Impatiens glandulifera]
MNNYSRSRHTSTTYQANVEATNIRPYITNQNILGGNQLHEHHNSSNNIHHRYHHPVAHPLLRNHNNNMNNYSRSRHTSTTYQANVEATNLRPHITIYPADEVAILNIDEVAINSIVVDDYHMHMDMAIRESLGLVQGTNRYLRTTSHLHVPRVRNHNSQLPQTLDIDHMSYEELLQLREQFPCVETGLSEENLNLRIQTHPFLESQLSSSSNGTNHFCVICQEKYEEYEKIGSLDCGHEYHVDCIKSWLKINNICPICKSSGGTKTEEN